MSEEFRDKIVPIDITKQIERSYINYAMSVIVARALPDVRDGFKPVHRRILYSMNELNLEPNKPYKKSARIVGDVVGKYHPHGESSVYDALVRMAQEWSMRYPIVDGQGNFGSIDGDSAAAMRYTEAKITPIAMEMIADIDKDTVDFKKNYTEEFSEPTVLPSKFPNLFVNGSAGIAVGMATNIPPHNLQEAIDGCLMIIDNFIQENRITEARELLSVIKGPDFPTGSSILGTSGIKSAYLTGRGKVIQRAEANIETLPGNRDAIIVTEIPYQVNKERLVEKIGELVKEKKIEGIFDLRDESNREGIRIVIELKKDANANVILNSLYKYTQMQETFGIIMLALVGQEPKVLNISEMLTEYVYHQKEVVTRRTRFDLNKALKRAHIIEGFLKALDFIDEIIAIIRANHEISVSKEIIMERFGFSKEQADAIVEMRLRSLSGLERERLEKELGELKVVIEELTAILADDKRLYQVIREELTVIRNKYGNERRTRIVPYEGEIEIADLIDEEMNVITMTHFDYIKRLTLDTYKAQNRGGRGIVGMTTRDEDLIKDLFIANTHDDMLFLTSFGKVYRIRVFEIPESGRTARGTAIVNLLPLSAGEKIASVIPVRDYEKGYLTMITRQGIIKKTAFKNFSTIKKSGLIALNIKEDDELISVMRTSGDDFILVATHNGMGIRFHEGDVREMGRSATGVKAIALSKEDFVIGGGIVKEGEKVLIVSQFGFGKCTEIQEFRSQSRNGKGLKVYRVTEKTGKIAGIAMVSDKDELMLINSEGIVIRIRVGDISTTGRIAQGVKLIQLTEGVRVVGVAKIAEDYITKEAEEIEFFQEAGMSETGEEYVTPDNGEEDE